MDYLPSVGNIKYRKNIMTVQIKKSPLPIPLPWGSGMKGWIGMNYGKISSF
jgi:hypothetical protein